MNDQLGLKYVCRIVSRYDMGVGKVTTHYMAWALVDIGCGKSWHVKIHGLVKFGKIELR